MVPFLEVVEKGSEARIPYFATCALYPYTLLPPATLPSDWGHDMGMLYKPTALGCGPRLGRSWKTS